MSAIPESCYLKGRMVSLCIYKEKPTVVIQDGDLQIGTFETFEEASDIFTQIIESWLEQEKIESAFFFQHPEISA